MFHLSSENIVLVGALLLFVAVMAGKLAYRFGAPALLLFLGVGMLFGIDFISYRSVEITQFVGMIALCIILFTGGFDTRYADIRPIIFPGVLLSTVGVMITAVILALLLWLTMPLVGVEMAFLPILLLASTMASTDSASVFSILRSKKQGLSQNLRPLLELESGSNDPMAYMMVVVLTALVGVDGQNQSLAMCLLQLVAQISIGAVAGYFIGRLAVVTINRYNITNSSLYSVLLLAFVLFSFSFTNLIQGNGYLAVYLTGLVVGNCRLAHKRQQTVFFDGFTWLMQIIMFLALGLFVNFDELLEWRTLAVGAMTGAIMIFVARPAAVMTCMLPFGKRFSKKALGYVSWVGLRGAVPILFALYPMAAGVEGSDFMFNVVFIGTIISLAVQGTTVSVAADLLGLSYAEKEKAFNLNMQDSITSVMNEIEVSEQMAAAGASLSDISLPDHTLVVMVYRDGKYFVPRGNTSLQRGDKLLVVSDKADELQEAYKNLGIDEFTGL